MSDLSKREVLQQLQDELPEEVKDCEKSIREDNPDMDKSTAIAICRDQLDMSDAREQYDLPDQLQDGPCEEGWVMVGTKQQDGQTVPNCVPEEDAPAPVGLQADCPEGQVSIGDKCVPMETIDQPVSLAAPRVMQSAGLDTEPLEREEVDDTTVRYNNIKLLDEGVWTDEASQTPTLYSAEHFGDYTPEFDSGEHNGPPVNIMHDLDAESGDPNEASVAGHIDPDSLEASDGGLFGDIVLDTSESAGEFADENLQSALESEGRKGFGGPSVELDPTDIRISEHPHADEEVHAAALTGTALVMRPASKSVDFSIEAAKRGVALADGTTDMGVWTPTRNMAKGEQEFDTMVDELSDAVSDAVEQRTSDSDMSESEARAEIIDDLATESDRDEDTIRAILDGEIDTVPDGVVAAFGEVLDVSIDDLGEDIEMRTMAVSDIRQTLDNFGMGEDIDDMDDEDVLEMATDLHEQLMADLEETEGVEMAEHGDDEDDEDDEEDGPEMSDLQARIDELEAKMDSLLSAEEFSDTTEELQADLSDTESELEETREQLEAARETIGTLEDEKDNLDKRLSQLEDEPAETRTLGEGRGGADEIDPKDVTPIDGP